MIKFSKINLPAFNHFPRQYASSNKTILNHGYSIQTEFNRDIEMEEFIFSQIKHAFLHRYFSRNNTDVLLFSLFIDELILFSLFSIRLYNQLKINIKDMIKCHFDKEENIPPVIRLHRVEEEVLAYA